MKNVVVVLLFCFAYIPLTGCSQEEAPSDFQLESLLKANKKSYQLVVDKFLAKGLYRLELMSNGDLHVMPTGVDVNSLVGMKELLENDLKIDLVNSSTRSEADDLTNEILFFTYRRGLVFAGEHKGLVYVVDNAEINPVSQLDEIDREGGNIHGKRLYKFIEPHWYIFYEYFP